MPSADVVRLLAEPSATPLALSTVLFPPTLAGLAERSIWPSSLFAGPSDWMTAQTVEAEAAFRPHLEDFASATELGKFTIPALVVSGSRRRRLPARRTPLSSPRTCPHSHRGQLPRAGYGAIIQDEPPSSPPWKSSREAPPARDDHDVDVHDVHRPRRRLRLFALSPFEGKATAVAFVRRLHYRAERADIEGLPLAASATPEWLRAQLSGRRNRPRPARAPR